MSKHDEDLRSAQKLLMAHNVIRIFGRVEEDPGNIILDCIQKAYEQGIKELCFLIHSGGGISSMGNAIHNAISLFNKVGGKTTGIVLSKCSSSASIILQGCTERLLMPRAQMVIHWGYVRFGNREQGAIMSANPEDYEWVLRQMRGSNNSMLDIYEKRSGIPRDVLIKLCDREEILHDDRIVKLGLADRVVHPDELELPEQMLLVSTIDSMDEHPFV